MRHLPPHALNVDRRSRLDFIAIDQPVVDGRADGRDVERVASDVHVDCRACQRDAKQGSSRKCTYAMERRFSLANTRTAHDAVLLQSRPLEQVFALEGHADDVMICWHLARFHDLRRPREAWRM